jgi:NADH-quinone oxidoreductase subunit N
MMPVGDVAPESAVLVAAVVVLVVAMFTPQRRQWLGAPLAIAGLGIACALTAGQIGHERLTFSGNWAMDDASVWARLLILGATAFTVLLAPAWLERDRRHGEYYAVLLLAALGAMVLAGAADLLQVVMGVLLSSVTGYTLAACRCSSAWTRSSPGSATAR